MDPHLLRTFVAVVRTGSFSAAARELGFTQSAVSQQVAALEHDLGVALLHRRPVAPTDAGQRLLVHAGPILLRLNAARADLQRLAGAAPASVLLGISPLAGADRAAAALVEAQRSMPRVSFAVRVTARDAVVQGVADGEFDAGIVDGVAAASDPLHLTAANPLTTVALAEGPLVVALPDGHPLAGRSALRLDDLADAGWIDAPDLATPLAQLRAVTRTDGFRPRLHYAGTDVPMLLALVAAGAGIALLPAGTANGVPVSAPRLVHRIELVHGTLTEPAAALAGVLKQRYTYG